MVSFFPTVPIVPGTPYFEEAKEGFERRLNEPGEVFMENLEQGPTGPAPALVADESGNVQIEHPEGFAEFNRSIIRTGGGDPFIFEEFNEKAREESTSPAEMVRRWVFILGALGVGLILLNTFVGGFAEGVAQR